MTYKAGMAHTADTITRLSLVQYRAFGGVRRLTRVGISAALICAGLWGPFTVFMSTVCLMAGCWILAGINFPARLRARRVIKAIDGRYPETGYEFPPEHISFRNATGAEAIEYGGIIRLVEDEGYFYIFVSRESAYMVDKSTVVPRDIPGFRDCLSKRAGLKWVTQRSILGSSLRTIISERKNTRL